MKVSVTVKLEGVLYEKNFDWDAIPAQDSSFQLTEGGWSEGVNRVWWSYTGEVSVELGRPTAYDGLKDLFNEGLADDLLKSGWHVYTGENEDTP